MPFLFQNPLVIALFAVQIILVVVLLVTYLLSVHARWAFKDRSDRIRAIAIRLAVWAYFIDYTLSAAALAVQGDTSRYFLIVYIIRDFLEHVAVIATIAIVSRMVLAQLHRCSAPQGFYNAVKRTSIVAFILITLLELASFGLYTAQIAREIEEYDNYYASYGFGYTPLDLAQLRLTFTLILLWTLFVFFLLLVTLVKTGTSVTPRGTRTLVIASLVVIFINYFLSLVGEGIANFGNPRDRAFSNFELALSFITIILSVVFLVLVVVMGLGKYRRELDTLGDSNGGYATYGDSSAYPHVAQNGAADRNDEQSYPLRYGYGETNSSAQQSQALSELPGYGKSQTTTGASQGPVWRQ